MEVSWVIVDWDEAQRLLSAGTIQKEWCQSQKWGKWVFAPSHAPPSDSAIQFQDSMTICEAILPHLHAFSNKGVAESLGIVFAMKPIIDLNVDLESVYAIYSPERVRSMLQAYDEIDYHALEVLYDEHTQAGEYDSICSAEEFSEYADQWRHVLAQASAQARGIIAAID